jgi:hypothetical protein
VKDETKAIKIRNRRSTRSREENEENTHRWLKITGNMLCKQHRTRTEHKKKTCGTTARQELPKAYGKEKQSK